MCDWKRYFDQIICLHYLPMKDRVTRIQDELNRVGISKSGIFKWDLSFDSPYYDTLRRNMKFSPGCIYGTDSSRFGQFKCSYQHYEVVKRSYDQGLRRILILEDDVIFLKDISLIEDILQKIPDTNIVLLDKFSCYRSQYAEFLENHEEINERFWKFDKRVTLYSSACYSLDRFGMEMVIRSQEMQFSPSDDIWNQDDCFINRLSKSVAITNLAIQKNFQFYNDMSFNENVAYKFVGLDRSLYD